MNARTLLLASLLAASAAPTVLFAQQPSERQQVKAANDAYYAAISAMNIEAIAKIWARSSDDTNIAPPVRPVTSRGWEAIKSNYQQFLGTLQEFNVSMAQPTITVHGSVAWVYGLERTHRKLKNGREQTGLNAGTSIFVKEDGQWRMIFHQAAALPPRK